MINVLFRTALIAMLIGCGMNLLHAAEPSTQEKPITQEEIEAVMRSFKPDKSVTPEKIDASKRAYHGCLRSNAEKMDDGVSEPKVIGKAVAAACARELKAFAEIKARAFNNTDETVKLYTSTMERESHNFATAAVSTHRRCQKK